MRFCREGPVCSRAGGTTDRRGQETPPQPRSPLPQINGIGQRSTWVPRDFYQESDSTTCLQPAARNPQRGPEKYGDSREDGPQVLAGTGDQRQAAQVLVLAP